MLDRCETGLRVVGSQYQKGALAWSQTVQCQHKVCVPAAMVLSSCDDQGKEPGSTSTGDATPFPWLKAGRGPALKATTLTEGWLYSVSTRPAAAADDDCPDDGVAYVGAVNTRRGPGKAESDGRGRSMAAQD